LETFNHLIKYEALNVFSMRNITVRSLRQIPLEQQRLEVVERKGLGHPDYICDAIMDQISVKLSKGYIDRFGTIMHHNVDKSLLVAGVTKTKFGGGEVEQPMLLIFGDIATFKVGEIRVPVDEIATQTAKECFKEKLRFVDLDEHVRYQVEIKPGSAELTDIFRRATKHLGANDTSAAVGYAPITRAETAVLKAESYINSREFKGKFPWSGEDVKVMSLQKNNELHRTIAMALVDRFIDDEGDYFTKKAEMLGEIESFLKENRV
jgi:S-adenosylmethionine synthetase